MPKNPIDYSKTIIYKIQHIEKVDLIYVGSTTNFTKRKSAHKACCINTSEKNYNNKKYEIMRENGGFEMFKMLEVKKFPCNDLNEARAEEDKVFLELKANMNTYKPFLSSDDKKIYKDEFKPRKKDYDINYRLINKDTRKIQKAEYYQKNKAIIDLKVKANSKKNKDKIKETQKKYREQNKDKIKEKKKMKIKCVCGCEILKCALKKHEQTKKHKDLMILFK